MSFDLVIFDCDGVLVDTERLTVGVEAKVLTELTSAHGSHPVYEIEWEGHPVATYHPGIGSPLAGMFLEEMTETDAASSSP